MGQTDGQTDGRTPDRDIDPAPHAGSVNNGSIHQGCSPKKRSGGRLKQDLETKIFKQFKPTYTYSQKNCHSGSLVLSCDTATRV